MKKKRTRHKPRNIIFPFSLLTALNLILALYYGNHIMWVSFFFLSAVLILDISHLFIMIFTKISIFQQLSVNLTECYSKIFLRVSLNKNAFYFVRYKVQNKFYYHRFFNKFDIPITVNKIGFYEIFADRIYIKSLFGLYYFPKKLKISYNDDLSCFVIPVIRTLELSSSLTDSFHLSPTQLLYYKNPYDDYIGNRDYMSGDPLKLINFKKSVTLRKTVVKEYATSEDGIIYNIFIESFNPQNFEIVAESALSANEFYQNLGAELLHFYTYNGFMQKYDTDNMVKLPSDIAGLDTGKPANTALNQIKTSHFPTVIVLSEYDKNKDLSCLESLPEGSMIFLVSSAKQYRKTIEQRLLDLDRTNILLVDDSMLSDINYEK